MRQAEELAFRKEQAFFVLDSDHLEEAETRLYGFAFLDGALIDRAEDLRGRDPETEGTFIFVKREGSRLTITQDFNGCFGLYLFRKGSWFALSNSVTLLTEHLTGRYPLTLNREYADYLLGSDMCASVYRETIVNEISELDRCAVVEIDIPARRLEIRYTDYQENTVDPGTEEGLALLDAWKDKWVKRIRTICSTSDHVEEDLSGGFDTRMILSLFLSAGVDMSRIRLFTLEDTLHTHREDYEIASTLARKYGFVLNLPDRHPETDPYPYPDTWAISFYTKLGAHKELYFKEERYRERKIHFTGAGGGCIREFLSGTEDSYIEKAVERCHRYFSKATVDCPRMERSTRKVLHRTFRTMRAHYASIGKPIKDEELFHILYRETRGRNHFGKEIIESWLSNTYNLSPLMDPDLQRLKVSSADCNDRSMVVALILSRFVPDLPDIPFDSNRFILPETLAFVRDLNRRFPPASPWNPPAAPSAEKPAEQPSALAKEVPLCRADTELKKAFLSPGFEKWFESLYEMTTYHLIRSDSDHRKFRPLYLVYAAAAIVKILIDEKAGPAASVPFTDYLRSLAEGKIPLSEIPSRSLLSRLRTRLLRQFTQLK